MRRNYLIMRKKKMFLISPVKKSFQFSLEIKMFFILCAWQGVHKEIPSLLHNDNASSSRHIHKHTKIFQFESLKYLLHWNSEIKLK